MKSTNRQRISKDKHHSLLETVIEYVIQGLSRTEILLLLERNNENLSKDIAEKLHAKALAAVREKSSTNAEDIVTQHVKWYEELYRKFDSMGYTPGKNAALRQKEKILGLLKEENIIKVENEINIDIKNEPQYDIKKLTKEEQERLSKYLKRVVA